MVATLEPQRILSARTLAKRVGVSRPVLAKHIRRGNVIADFTSDAGEFFKPERITEVRDIIEENRRRQAKHLAA